MGLLAFEEEDSKFSGATSSYLREHCQCGPSALIRSSQRFLSIPAFLISSPHLPHKHTHALSPSPAALSIFIVDRETALCPFQAGNRRGETPPLTQRTATTPSTAADPRSTNLDSGSTTTTTTTSTSTMTQTMTFVRRLVEASRLRGHAFSAPRRHVPPLRTSTKTTTGRLRIHVLQVSIPLATPNASPPPSLAGCRPPPHHRSLLLLLLEAAAAVMTKPCTVVHRHREPSSRRVNR